MASQVLSGSSNPSYTNNTGENVRVVINFMTSRRQLIQESRLGGFRRPIFKETLNVTWSGVGVEYSTQDRVNTRGEYDRTAEPATIGRNLAFTRNISVRGPGGGTTFIGEFNDRGDTPQEVATDAPSVAAAAVAGNANCLTNISFPTEIILAPGQTFSAICGVHNIVVIPENG